jgi:hypothetical protein
MEVLLWNPSLRRREMEKPGLLLKMRSLRIRVEEVLQGEKEGYEQ